MLCYLMLYVDTMIQQLGRVCLLGYYIIYVVSSVFFLCFLFLGLSVQPSFLFSGCRVLCTCVQLYIVVVSLLWRRWDIMPNLWCQHLSIAHNFSLEGAIYEPEICTILLLLRFPFHMHWYPFLPKSFSFLAKRLL